MIQLTDEQRQELSVSEPIAVDLQTGQEYVLIRKQSYERLKSLLHEDSTLDVKGTYPFLDEVAEKAGWGDPAMDVYNQLGPKETS